MAARPTQPQTRRLPIRAAVRRMLLYPGMTLLDLIGPQSCFISLAMTVHLVWKTRDPITTDSNVTLVPTTAFAECPQNLEILFVPGSTRDTATMIRDAEVQSFLSSRGGRAKLVTSVCTGSLILGAAGLLRGYEATSHWLGRELLPLVGAERIDARYVEDRNRITGAGVTSGIDFSLRLVEKLRGRQLAEVTQLMLSTRQTRRSTQARPKALSVSALATRVGMSPRNFARAFRRELPRRRRPTWKNVARSSRSRQRSVSAASKR